MDILFKETKDKTSKILSWGITIVNVTRPINHAINIVF